MIRCLSCRPQRRGANGAVELGWPFGSPALGPSRRKTPCTPLQVFRIQFNVHEPGSDVRHMPPATSRLIGDCFPKRVWSKRCPPDEEKGGLPIDAAAIHSIDAHQEVFSEPKGCQFETCLRSQISRLRTFLATTWAALLPSRVPASFDSPLDDFFDRVVLVADLALFGAASGDCAPTVAMAAR